MQPILSDILTQFETFLKKSDACCRQRRLKEVVPVLFWFSTITDTVLNFIKSAAYNWQSLYFKILVHYRFVGDIRIHRDGFIKYQVSQPHPSSVMFSQRLCPDFYTTIGFRIGYMRPDSVKVPAGNFLFLPDLMYIICLPVKVRMFGRAWNKK